AIAATPPAAAVIAAMWMKLRRLGSGVSWGSALAPATLSATFGSPRFGPAARSGGRFLKLTRGVQSDERRAPTRTNSGGWARATAAQRRIGSSIEARPAQQGLVRVPLECVFSFFNMPIRKTEEPTVALTALAPEIQDRRARAKAWFESLQQRICAELERLEAEAPAELYPGAPGRVDLRPWKRETGEGGGIGGFLSGRLFEKAGVHTSAATAKFSPEMAKTMPGAE